MKNMNIIMCSCALLTSVYCFEANGSDNEKNANAAVSVEKQNKTAQWQASWAKGFSYENEKAAEEHWLEIASAPENSSLKWNEWCYQFVNLFDEKCVAAGGVISGDVPLSLIEAKGALMYDKYVKNHIKSRFDGHETDIILDMLENYTKNLDQKTLKESARWFIQQSEEKYKHIRLEQGELRERLEKTKDTEKEIIDFFFEILQKEEDRVSDYERVVSPLLEQNENKKSAVVTQGLEVLTNLTDVISEQNKCIQQRDQEEKELSVLKKLNSEIKMQLDRIQRIKELRDVLNLLREGYIQIELKLSESQQFGGDYDMESGFRSKKEGANSSRIGQERRNARSNYTFAPSAVPINHPKPLLNGISDIRATTPELQSQDLGESFGSLGGPRMSVNAKPFVSSRSLGFSGLSFNGLPNSSSSSSSSGSTTQEEFRFNDDDETATVVHEGEFQYTSSLERDFGVGDHYDNDEALQKAIEMSVCAYNEDKELQEAIEMSKLY